MRSKTVALLLADLGVTKTHSRPYTATDNPFSEAQFKTMKYRPTFPHRFGSLQHARSFCVPFFGWYNTECHFPRSWPIDGEHPYLYLDATFVDARWARKVENVSALVAYAVGPDGHRQLLGVLVAAEESEARWSELLQQLTDRGLTGVELVIADEHAGLAAAVRRWLPEAKRQRCTVHLQRNVLTKAPQRLRKRLAREVAGVFRASSLGDARKQLARLQTRWSKELPKAMACLTSGFTAATTFYAFPDRASALRLITAVALKVTTIWGERRYVDVSLLENQDVDQAA